MTLIEILCALLILGLIGLLSTRILENFVRGYTVARNSDATVQKAQNALQRLTLEFTYLDMTATVGNAANMSYTSSLDGGVTVKIFQSDNSIIYQRGGANYILTDGVASGSLAFSYFANYNATATTTSNASTQLIGFGYTMVGSDPSLGFSQPYATRVKVNKVQ